MKKLIRIFLLLAMVRGSLQAQTAEDALRYSRVLYGGTSRFNGLSGAFGAVGADFSTLSTNPAGLGLYRGSEMTLSIAPHFGYSSTTYNSFTATDSKGNFGLGNFGFVFNINTSHNRSAGPVKSVNVGFGFNRQNDFNNRVIIHGVNTTSSLMQSYANTLNNNSVPPNLVMDQYPFDIGLAYGNGNNLVYYDSVTNKYYCDAMYGGVMQDKIIETHGSMNEMDFAVAANLADKLFLGFTLGVPFIDYYEHSTYRETQTGDTIPYFLSARYDYNLHTRGTGVNLKFGAIYKPTDWVRIGLAVHTPTWYPGMNDQWSSVMQSSFTTTAWNQTNYSPLGYYDYKLTTPFRAMGSLAFIIGQYGLVSADYEYVNYSQARFSSNIYSYSALNNDIQSSYKSWGNLRFGTEWRVMDFRVRGGFGYFSNPYSGSGYNGDGFQLSAGIGYRVKYFYIDFTYVWAQMKQQYYLYDATMVNPADISLNSHTFSTTLGFRF